MRRHAGTNDARPIRICAYCDAVRALWPDGTERWGPPQRRGWVDGTVSHGICPRCYDEIVTGLEGKLYGNGLDSRGNQRHSGLRATDSETGSNEAGVVVRRRSALAWRRPTGERR